jgi:hypothetical protein
MHALIYEPDAMLCHVLRLLLELPLTLALLLLLLLLLLLRQQCLEGVHTLGSYSRSFPCTLTRLRSTNSPAKSFSVHLPAKRVFCS